MAKAEQSKSSFGQLGTPSGASMPTFQGGGLEDFRRWMMGHLQFPLDLPSRFTQATVVVEFVVETDGSLTITDMDDEMEPSIRAEIIRAFAKCPRWRQGTQLDEQTGELREVRVHYHIPFIFGSKKVPFSSTKSRSYPKQTMPSSARYDHFGNRRF